VTLRLKNKQRSTSVLEAPRFRRHAFTSSLRRKFFTFSNAANVNPDHHAMSSQDLPFIPPFPMSGIKRSRSYLEEQSSDNEESFNDNGNKMNRTGASPQHLSHEDVGSAEIEENPDDEEQSESDESESEAAESDGEPQHATTELEKILKSMQNPLEDIDCDVSAEDLSKIIKTINANADE